jgi:hypothetical protein
MTLNKTNTTFAPRQNSSVSVLPYPYIGFVKSNVDPQFMGRLGVWIPELCGDPLENASWILCSYCSPFAGATNINELENYQDKASKTVAQQSYGWVSVPPDINSEVMVIFAGGDISRAYWIGCTYQQNMDHMVPGIAVDTTYAGQQTTDGTSLPVSVPVIEYNKASVTGNPTNVNRPVFQPLATGLVREGLLNDLERGAASTSMRREAPPLSYGLLSPRGNTIHIDDQAENEFIRLRTRSGAQILIHETTGFVYINSKDGNSWFEISDAGIDGYTAQSISLRAASDINLVASGNIVLDAAANIYLRAGKDINLSAGGKLGLSAGTEINLASAAIQIGASGNLTMSAGGDVNSAAGGKWARKGSPILDNSGAVPNAVPGTNPTGKTVSDVTQEQHGTNRATWTPGGGTINTIAARVPTHEPWSGHPNSKVPPNPVTTAPVIGPGAGGTPPPSGAAPSSCSFGAAKTKPIGSVAYNAIAAAASKTGVNQATLLAFADQESSFNPSATPPVGGAAGLFQFIPKTWSSMIVQHGGDLNIATGTSVLDPNANALMGAQYILDNQSILQGKGLATDPGNLYLMHFLGGNQGPTFIQQAQSNPDASAASLFPAAAKANPNIFYNTPGDGSPKTMAQVNTNLTTMMNSKAQAYASQTGLPAPCQRQTGTPSGVAHKIDPNNAIASAQSLTGRYWNIPASPDKEACVALLQSEIANVPSTSRWTRGQGNLTGNPPTPGTPIATFNDQGHYTNTRGISHAAIYLAPAADGNGIQVLEQYDGTMAHIHTYKNGDTHTKESDARSYYVININ